MYLSRIANQYFFVDQDRNPSSYFQVSTYNQDLLTAYDDGNQPSNIFSYDAKVKFMVDAYNVFGGADGTTQ